MTKKKFLDPNIENKSKTVEKKIQFFKFEGAMLPLPTEIEISESGTVTDPVHFVLEALQALKIKKNLLAIPYMKSYAENSKIKLQRYN